MLNASVATSKHPSWRATALVLLAAAGAGGAAEAPTPAADTLASLGITGGLCVQVGWRGGAPCAELARTGRFLVHVLEPRAAAVGAARQWVRSRHLYGLVSVERLKPGSGLPYTENLVNVVVLAPRPDCAVPLAEVTRVLCPGGAALAARRPGAAAALKAAGLDVVGAAGARGAWEVGRKPWPRAMDDWPHPRHGADANAVSRDALVGPPRRVRWVAGPPQKTSHMVSARGRNFYAGVLVRDSFNGLRLWGRVLYPAPARGGYAFALPRGSMRPVAVGGRLLVVADGRLTMLEGATGQVALEYPEAGTPTDVLEAEGTILAVDKASVRALAADSSLLRWRRDALRPRHVVAAGGAVYFVEGRPQRGEKCAAVCVGLATGSIRWRRDDLPWLAKARGCVYHSGQLAYEVSTLNDDKPGNEIHVVSAADGKTLWSHVFVPGMTHGKQARAMVVGDLVWLLTDGGHKPGDQPGGTCRALDWRTGEVKRSFKAGWGHCFPPVATTRYLFAGEMAMTDLATGQVDENRITKGACGRDIGVMPANGLIYSTPKHCVCWPMLRGFTALAPARPGGSPADGNPSEIDFVLERGVAPPAGDAADTSDASWPCYRHDAWRSGSTPHAVPASLRVLWTARLGGWPEAGPIARDWRDNPFVKGPVTSPVIAGGLVFVARPDAHELVALDAGTGSVRWRFTANARIDTPPTVHRGLCLFGTKSGWVVCLRAADGRLVWRLRAAPLDERIVAYGQLESPWPVPGSVLVVDGVAFFAAGRQSYADGGILVFAVDPATGKRHWVQRLDTVPQKWFYGDNHRESDNFDLLHRQGKCVAMSRWLFDRKTGRMRANSKHGFAHLATGGAGVMMPQGAWSYAPRHETVAHQRRPFRRPLVVFRDDALYGCSEDTRTVYRRDFRLGAGEKFDPVWYRSIYWLRQKKIDELWRSQRLAKGATWSVEVFAKDAPEGGVAAMVLTRDALFVAGLRGGLAALSVKDGAPLARAPLPAPVWDGMAAATGRLFVSTLDGRVLCLCPK